MTGWLKQSTSVSVVIGPVWATADGSLKADLAYNASGINCDVYKNGTKADVTLANSAGDGYFRAASGEALYLLTLSTGHTDTLGMFTISLSATGYYMKPQHYMVVPANVWDSMFGADTLKCEVVEISGDTAAADNLESYCDGTTPIPANVTQLSGDATAADNAESFFDGTGYTGSNNVIGTVTSLTNKTGFSLAADQSGVTIGTANTIGSTGTAAVKTAMEAAGSHLALIKAKTDNLPADPADDSDIDAQLATIAGYIDTEIAAILAAVDTEIAAIKAKTDQLNFSGTDVKATLDGETVTVGTNNDKTGYALTAAYDAAKTAASQSSVNTVAGYIDTEVAAILAAVDTEVAAIKTVTDAIGATGTGLTAIPWNSAWDAEVQSECTDALNAYDPPTHTEMTSAFSTTNGKIDAVDDFVDTEVAAVLAAVDTEVAAIKAKTDNLPASPAAVGSQMDLVNAPNATAITAIQSGLATAAALDAVDNFVDTEVGAIKAVTDKLDTALELDSTVYRFTTNALEQGPSGTGATAQQVWEYATRTLTSAGSGGATLEEIEGSTVLAKEATLTTIDTVVDAIKTKTDQLNFSGTDVKATLDGETVTVATNNDKTGYALTSAYDAAKTAAAAGAKMDLVDAPNATALAAVAVAILDTLLSEGDADALNARTVRSALRALRNKTSIAAGTMTVCKENDSDAAWTAAATTDPAAEPITEIDPA